VKPYFMSFPLTKQLLLFSLCVFLTYSCKKTISSSSSGSTQNTVHPVPTAVGTTTGDSVSVAVGASGGSVKSADGMVELDIPAGALSANTIITVQPITNNCPGGGLEAYRFGPNGLHFNQPVTLKIHYTDAELQSTLADLMGIAFQDSSGIWYRFKNFTNDSVQKVLTVSIKHFTDYAEFYTLHINPESATVATDSSVNLQVEVYYSDDDELVALPGSAPPPDIDVDPIIVYKANQSIWTINGGLTDQDYGSITNGQGTLAATYKAPSAVPTSGNPVAVSATIDMGGMVFHGKKFNKTSLVSNITVVGKKRSYFIQIALTLHGIDVVGTTAFGVDYTDNASFNFDILTTFGGLDTIRLYNFVNQAPVVNPTSGIDGFLTYTYSPDPYGLMNITGGDGDALPSYGPGQVFLGTKVQIRPIHTGAMNPLWNVTGTNFPPAHYGGGPSLGIPLTIDFYEKDQVQVIDPMINGVAGELLYTISPVQ
jgi:hypothetical protein